MIAKILYPVGIWLNALALLAIPPVSRQRRQLIYGALTSLSRRLPLVTLDRLLQGMPDAEQMSLRVLETRDHNVSTFELVSLAAIARRLRPQLALEIGTYDGRSTMAIATNTPGKVVTVNLPPDYMAKHPDQAGIIDVQLSQKVVSAERVLAPEKDRIEQVFADSTKLDFEPYRGAGLIFIDGGHSYDVVKADTENALRIIDRRDGAIVWHDAVHYGVGTYLPELAYPVHQIDGTTLAVLLFRNGQPVNLSSGAA